MSPLSPADALRSVPGGRAAESWRKMLRSPRTKILAAVLVAVALAGAIAPWSVSRDALREDITGQLRASSGLFVFTRGRTSIALLPRPHIRFDDLALVDPAGALVIEADTVRGDLRLLPLLTGRLEIGEIGLQHPAITVDIDRRPMMTAGAAVRAAETPRSSAQAERTDSARLGIVTITDGSANLRRGGVSVAQLEHLDARLDWRTVAAPLTLTGRAAWRGEPRDLSLWIGQPAALLRGEPSPLALQIKGDGSSLTTTGTGVATPRPRFEGRIQAATTGLPGLLRSFGVEAGLPAVLSGVTVDADVVATPTATTLNNLRLRAGDDDFEGTLAVQQTDGRPILSGTLATQNLSIGPYFADLPALTGPDGRFGAEPIDLRHAAPLDLDLRLSASQLRFGRLRAQDAAMALFAKGGRYEFAIADAQAYKGALKARAVVAPAERDGDLDFQANVQMRGIDWGAVDWELGGNQRVTGLADLALSVQGNGDSFQKIARDLQGQGRVAMTKGDISGLDLAGTLSRLDKRPLAAATDMGSGHTPFDRASFTLDIKDGIGTVTGGSVDGTGYHMSLGGLVRIGEGQLGLKAAVRTQQSEAPSESTPPAFTFEVSGPWSRPAFLPDVRGWIRRSDAASPLFDAPPAATTNGR